MRRSNTGEAVTNTPFITVNILETLSPGLPQRKQIDDQFEQITENRIATIRVQAYGAGAMTTLFRLRAWLGSSPGMQALKLIRVSSPAADEPRDVSGAVSTGFEERALMNITLSYADIYQIEQETIGEVNGTIFTDNPPSETKFSVKK